MMAPGRPVAAPYRVYVMLGLHTSFHHSWRGDTPDEAGFGTDIRVVRRILDLLDGLAAEGLQVRSYWDLDVYWTVQRILPVHAPDIIDGIRRRVDAGLDEIVLGPYNNGANHAATERELRTAIAHAIENPYGSGLRQVFGRVSTLYRPQESVLTPGQNAVFLQEGVSGLVLYYAGVPFNALSTFVPTLPPEQRYGTVWLRCQPDEPPLVLWPCISPADLVENVCLEALLLELRRLQTSGQVQSDLLVHLNFDADAETWLPVGVPRAVAWFPNTGGLVEYAQVVNRYPWAEFTVPSEYAASHPPRGELLVRQDLADGGFDGNYSWAEKYTSLVNWTALEQSRLHTYRAEALASRLPESTAGELRQRLWQGVDSAFFLRLVGLSTTHFGMSTPVINEERQAKAARLLGGARDQAASAERDAALALRRQSLLPQGALGSAEDGLLYLFEIVLPIVEEGPGDFSTGTPRGPMLVRLPLILPPGVRNVRLEESGAQGHRGEPLAASLLDPIPLVDGRLAADLVFISHLAPGQVCRYRVTAAPVDASAAPAALHVLQNRWLEVRLSPETGVASISYQGRVIGSRRFLAPFVTYRSGRRVWRWEPSAYHLEALPGEQWQGLTRARLRTEILMATPTGPVSTRLVYTFTLFDDLPYLLLDVAIDYARTVPADIIQTIQQRLRRLLDLRWVEVAPCQLTPEIEGRPGRPLRVWKHNYLGVTSYYDLDYGRTNLRNRELDSFNHQVTAGWVAISDRQRGLLLAECADVLASMAFCPMRLREQQGVQRLSLNPFGSYHGHQMDYRHLGGNGIGAQVTAAASGSLRPNGPSFNGQRLAFSLLLAPYAGDEPPTWLQADAWAFFYPAGAVYLRTPAGLEAVVPADLRRLVAASHRQRLEAGDEPIPTPGALLANPAPGAVNLAWEPPHDPRLTGYEVRWRGAGTSGWQSQSIPPGTRWQVSGLDDGQSYRFQVRAVAGQRASAWTPDARTVPGSVAASSLFSMMPSVSPGAMLRLVGHSLAAVLRARLARGSGR